MPSSSRALAILVVVLFVVGASVPATATAASPSDPTASVSLNPADAEPANPAASVGADGLRAADAGRTTAVGTDRRSQQDNASICSFEHPSWRAAQLLAGVRMQAEQACRPDDPNVVAASVLGTNNVPDQVLKNSGLSRDAVVKGEDLDGDGDPDEIHVTLEVMGVNENDSALRRDIAPGISPAFWVFAPKTRGMVTDGSTAARLVRMPSPSIRVEAGDHVTVTLENTHYFPHTVHFHGVDHPFEVNGSGNDGVPQTSETPVPPGGQRTYEFTPRQPGTFFYHCHVVPSVHVKMGLSGMFVVTENRSDNRVQTLNVGGGKVRHPGQAMAEDHDAVYDLVYQGVDATLHDIPKRYDDVRRVAKAMNREYDSTDATMDYFLLNGRSFPYTLRESVVAVEPDGSYRLRVLNAGSRTVSLHTHGHKFTIEALDGVEVPEGTERTRDVVGLTAAQRADIVLNTTDDGRHAYGPGVWLLHDHREPAVTNDGIGPGGTVSMIAYDSYLDSNGVPETNTNLSRYFDPAFYDGSVPVWEDLDAEHFGDPPSTNASHSHDGEPATSGGGERVVGLTDAGYAVFGLAVGLLLAGGVAVVRRWRE